MIALNSLKNIPSDILFEAFSDAFIDYEMQLNQPEFERSREFFYFIQETKSLELEQKVLKNLKQ